MYTRSSHRFLIVLAWALLALPAIAPVHASTILKAASVDMPGLGMRNVKAELGVDPEGQLQLTLQAERVDLPVLGWRRVGLELHGRLMRLRKDMWTCNGSLRLRGAPGGLLRRQQDFVLTIDVGANTLQLDLGKARGTTVSLAMPLDQLSHMQATWTQVPLSWLQGPLSHAWAGRLTSGSISGTLAMDVDGERIQGSALLNLSKAAFDGGTLAGEKLAFKGRVNFRSDAKRSQTSVSGTLHGGDVLMGPVYATLPRQSAPLAFDLVTQGGSMRVDHLRFTDRDTLTLAGGFIFGKDGSLHSMALSHFNAHFPQAYQRYGRTWLDTLGLRNLETAGELSGAIAFGPRGLTQLRMQASAFDLADADGRFRIAGLDGGLDWSPRGVLPGTELSWKGLGLFRIPFGAGESRWRSRDGTLRLQAPMTVPVFGGELGIQRFAWQPSGEKGSRLDIASTIIEVDMQRLSRALGWPTFRGTLGGAMPGLHYADGRIDLQGGLSLHVFDGFVNVTHLSLAHPFSGTPELAAEIGMEKLDLGAMTDVFHFGKITGRMHGRISGLHLVDWTPVGFQATLLADSGGRISQRAVNNLTSVGGGGAAGGLQGAMLRLFKNFSYSRIGLNCTLKSNICHMDGLKPEGGGYLIVEGRGLPHLTVIGHQRQVSWSTLVSRLRAAIQSGGPTTGS